MNEFRERRIREVLFRELASVSTDGDPLDLVQDIPIVEAFLGDFSDARIAEARASGASWADIAERLGVSRQAVHKRFTTKPKGRRRGPVIELRFERRKD